MKSLRYLKDYDYYEKCASEREKEERPLLKRSSAGCLCFSSKARRSSAHISTTTDNSAANAPDAIDVDIEAMADGGPGPVPEASNAMDM